MRTAAVRFEEVCFVPGGFAHTPDKFSTVYSVDMLPEPGSVHSHFIHEVSPTGKSFKFWHAGKATTWRAVRHWQLFIVVSSEVCS